MDKAVFLDRDGVINYDPDDYTYKLEDIELLPGIIPFAKKVVDKGYKIIVITNQGGINKKRYGVEDVDQVHNFIDKEFKKEGIEIVDFFFCPHHSDIQKCICRKPDTLMLQKAMHLYNIDPNLSYFIGDKWRDVECGEKAGVKGLKIDVNVLRKDLINLIA